MPLEYYRTLSRLLLLTMLLVSGCRSTFYHPSHPCDHFSLSEESLLLLSEAAQQLQSYLQNQAVRATVTVKEEGSFMLGAYPRSRALWSIRISAPALAAEDTARLDNLALAAYCLRPGWVWLKFTLPSGDTTMISYAQIDLEELYQKKGAP